MKVKTNVKAESKESGLKVKTNVKAGYWFCNRSEKLARASKESGLTSIVVMLLVVLPATGCMTSPFDGQQVDSEFSVVTFSGYHLVADSPVSIRAFDPVLGEWYEIGLATSASQVTWVAMDGTDVYYWEESVVVPLDFWERGISGARAWVAAVSEGYELMTVNSGWTSCYFMSTDLSDFSENCAADESPVARLYTTNYLGLPDDVMPLPPPVGNILPLPPPLR